MSIDFDAVVAGGSLAGCAFAITLARAGWHVTLIERTAGPVPKVCGDFLSAEAQMLLEAFGIVPAALGAAQVSMLRLVCGAHSAQAPLAFSGAGLTRLRLDEEMLAAAQRAGVTVVRNCTVRAMRAVQGTVELETSEGTISAGHAALATGKHNLRGHARPLGEHTAYKMTFRPSAEAVSLLSGTVQLAAYDGGYLGACLVENDAMTVCWLPGERLISECGGDATAQLDYLAATSPHIAALVANAEPVFTKPATVSAIPYGYLRREPVAPHIYALGDQLAVIPSLTGDGTSIALATGRSAANAVLAGIPADVWHRDVCGKLAPQFRIAGIAEQMFARAPLRHAGVALARIFPGLVTRISAATRLDRALLDEAAYNSTMAK